MIIITIMFIIIP